MIRFKFAVYVEFIVADKEAILNSVPNKSFC